MINNKLLVLKKVAEIFNQNDITWAVGASALLYFKDLVDDFRDIDLLIAERDVASVQELLADVGTIQPKKPDAQYKTKVFLKYMIDGVEFDIMAGFVIVSNGIEHYFPLKKEDIKDGICLDGVKIPLQSIQEWKHYYSLMGRIERVELIRSGTSKM